jgi:hypothetical protein
MLKLHTAVCFLAGEEKMMTPSIVHLLPHFKPPISNKIHIELPKEQYYKI